MIRHVDMFFGKDGHILHRKSINQRFSVHGRAAILITHSRA